MPAQSRPVVDETTGEPLRMGARVRDRDGLEWVRKRTRWVCTAPVGHRYYDTRRHRYAVVEQVGRLPWHGLQTLEGPVTVVDLNDRADAPTK